MQSSFPSKYYSFLILILASLLCNINIQAGVGAAYDFISDSGVKKAIGGYIKAEYYYDSRQVEAFSVDQFLLYPKKKILDPCCKDLNRRGEGHFVALESRLSFSFRGTKVKTADLSGIIEGDFWAAASSVVLIPNIFRLRHAAIFLDWPCITLTMGQHWHPITIEECFPDTISFNNGSPMDPYGRSPLIKIDCKRDTFHLIAGAAYELDFNSFGPEGFNPVYMARGLIPNFDLQFKKFFGEHAIGALIDYLRLVPRIKTAQGYSVVEPLSSFTSVAWLALNWSEKFAWHQKVAYSQNGAGYGMIGGYATTNIDPCTGKKKYTNISALAYWWDLIACPGQTVEPGLFVGAVKNLGAMNTIIPDTFDDQGILIDENVFGFGTDVNYVFRVAPRMRWRMSKELTIAAEFEFTRAAFGTIVSSGNVVGAVPVNNMRGLCAAYYTF